MKAETKYACSACGRLVSGREKHDLVDCVLYRSRGAGFLSDPINRDLSILRDHVLKLEPERDTQ